MIGALTPVDARWMARDVLDGGTVLSDEIGLPGPVRALSWAVIDDTGSPLCLHLLFDSSDLETVFTAALDYAQGRQPLTAGTVAITRGDISAATVKPYRSNRAL